jgi:hypothetical protein
MVQANDIRSAIAEYLGHRLTFDQFEDWIIINTQNIHKWGDEETIGLANAVDHRIAEYVVSDTGKITENLLRSELLVLANTHLSVPKTGYVTTASTTSLAQDPIEWKIPAVDKTLGAASSSLIAR